MKTLNLFFPLAPLWKDKPASYRRHNDVSSGAGRVSIYVRVYITLTLHYINSQRYGASAYDDVPSLLCIRIDEIPVDHTTTSTKVVVVVA